jgi:hypothetical protein
MSVFQICCWIVAFACVLVAAVLSVHSNRVLAAAPRRGTSSCDLKAAFPHRGGERRSRSRMRAG